MAKVPDTRQPWKREKGEEGERCALYRVRERRGALYWKLHLCLCAAGATVGGVVRPVFVSSQVDLVLTVCHP